jgi:hypothetical protein
MAFIEPLKHNHTVFYNKQVPLACASPGVQIPKQTKNRNRKMILKESPG